METTTKIQVKTIDIQAKEWFDKVNGNSYFSGVITVNFGMPDERTFKMPFQYGYGEQYLQEAKALLFCIGYIHTKSSHELREQGIILRASKKENCKKADVKAYGL